MPPSLSTRRPRKSEGKGEDLRLLHARLAEAEQTLQAIRDGSVDALVVSTADGDRVYALHTADRSYRRIVESVHEGAATLTEAGTVFYANRSLAELIGAPLERVIGSSFAAWVEEPEAFEAWLRNTGMLGVPPETRLACRSGRSVPVYLTLSRLEGDEGPGLVLMVSDLRPQQRHAALVASEELSRSILEQAADAVLVCDANGC